MYHQLLPLVRDLLTATRRFGTVVCGTATGAYPLANVVLRSAMPAPGRSVEEATLVVQVSAAAGDDSEAAYLETLELLAVAKQTLHDARLPGVPARKLQAVSVEALRVESTGEMIYFLPVSLIFDPA